MKKITLYPRLVLVLAALAAGPSCNKTKACPAAPAAANIPAAATVTVKAAEIVARVNGVPITRWDVEALSKKGGHGRMAQPGSNKRILENIIQQEVTRQRAVKLGLHRETHLQETLQAVKARSAAQERGVLYEALLNREVTGKIAITDADVKKFWDKNRAEVRTSIHVLQILRRNQPAILKAQAALKAGKSFVEVARNRPGVAGHGSRHKFWDVGFLRWVQVPAFWRGHLSKLKTGEVSGIVKGPGSRFWILKVEGRKEDTAGTLESYQAAIKGTLKRDRLEARRSEVLNGLRREARIEYSLDKGIPAAKKTVAEKK